LTLPQLTVNGPALRGAVRLWTPLKSGAYSVSFAIAALVTAPLASLAVIAAAGDPDIWAHLSAYVLPESLKQTALLLVGVALVATIAGAGPAWLLSTFQFPGRNALLWLLPLPLAIPTYIAAYVYVAIFDAAGPIQTSLRAIFGWQTGAEYWFPPVRSPGGAILIIGFVVYPYVYLAARAMFQTQCAVFQEAARTVGARPWALARDITLPLARPALAAGLALALLETLNDIGACEYLGVQTLTISVFTTWLNRGSLAGAAQIALVMLLVVVMLVGLERYGRRRRDYGSSSQDARIVSRITLSGRAAWLASFICFIPVALGFLIPAAYLVHEVVLRGLLIGFDSDLFRHTITTISLATAATITIIVLGIYATVALRLVPRTFVLACVTIGTIGYAIPGTVLALGLLTPLVLVDDAINWFTSGLGVGEVGLVLAGSGAALVIAYTVRFLAIAIGLMNASLGRVPTDFDDIARLSGAGPAKLVRSVHLPLLRPAMWGAALLIFVDCLKELPATLLLRPLNVETLSTYIYQFATRGEFEEGSLAALIIVAAGLLPMIRIVKHVDLGLAGSEPIR